MELDNYSKYGLLYLEYKKEAYYWELVKMLIKILIIVVTFIFTDKIIFKGMLMVLLL